MVRVDKACLIPRSSRINRRLFHPTPGTLFPPRVSWNRWSSHGARRRHQYLDVPLVMMDQLLEATLYDVFERNLGRHEPFDSRCASVSAGRDGAGAGEPSS